MVHVARRNPLIDYIPSGVAALILVMYLENRNCDLDMVP